MNFTEPAFLIFFPLFFAFYCWLRRDLQKQNLLVAVASYFFYGWFDWRFCFLLLASTALDFYFGLAVDRALRRGDREFARLTLGASLICNLAILGFFKYFNFFVDNASAITVELGLGDLGSFWRVALPAGISFYTFQSLSYIFDIYDGKVRATSRFLDYAVFVSFFPHLVAGPILRAKDLLPKIIEPRPLSLQLFLRGLQLTLWGFFVKLVIADHMAPIVDRAFANPNARGAVIIIGVYAFAFQIYCDFMGYTSIARGIARMMGFELVLNFNLPYFATNPSDFWRRWHISLSTWLRDYLYIRIGGNRGPRWHVYRNLMVTMLLGGLWHGANWTFIIWGVYHGLLLCAHRAWSGLLMPRVYARSWHASIAHAICIVLFFQFTALGWLIFRAASATDLASKLQSILRSTEPGGFLTADAAVVAAFVIPFMCFEIYQYRTGELEPWRRWPAAVRVVFYTGLVVAIAVLKPPVSTPFIYFQF
ncbi:MAG: alginate O-acetyltransferase complex protein AlgI [Hyphomicrobiales bacterium]|jgi:D-alanyl-lipoteichoic acid acyltransferase DltB (MBOAT superfamily)|nr:alginate O-acetyltransferase complex protein AlgI [Hyphomicrobiales bacterium]